ncbi:MAG: inositol monophosphatase [Candidatus Omnitrophica bacterium]|nr:inositol monophosphatase [Candidatus Omnitrophota bacterium]
MNRRKIKSTLLDALVKAGKLLKTSIQDRRITAKKSELNLVTATDQAAETLILGIIQRKFPDHAILSEESPAQGNSSSRWIIDPLDGTTNFAHTYPHCCVSIAFEENGNIEFGGVFDPFRNEVFFAERGKGASLNGKPIAVSKVPALGESLLCTGFPYDRREKPDEYLDVFRTLMVRVHGIRRSGAAALDLCYVACGRFDGFWELKLNPWDKAAGMLMVQEAGGRLSDFSGSPLTLEDVQNVASNGFIHEEMLEALRPFKEMEK